MGSDKRNIFEPLQVGRMILKHRVVMAPLTRFRADTEHVHTDLGVEYYQQRSSVPGTLLISEATNITHHAGQYQFAPGIYDQEQIDAWRKVTDAVHANGSFIYLQLWALGRAAKPAELDSQGFEMVSASDIPLQGTTRIPRPLTVKEIQQYVKDYAQAAKNAITAGFDGVEIHNANGYLLDQFLQDVSNKRTDQYGGSIENRARFPLEVLAAVTNAIGQDRTGIRISPFSTFQDMKMADPIPQFSYFVSQVAKHYPQLAYLHAIEPRGSVNVKNYEGDETLDFINDLWPKKSPFFRAGGFDAEQAIEAGQTDDRTVIVMGRLFISNPDLPLRMEKGIELTPYDRTTFYNHGEARGYTDYPFADQTIKAKA